MAKAFRIVLEGSQEVPSVTTAASGVGTVVFDDTAVTARYDIVVRGIDFAALGVGTATADTGDDVASMHFHNGARGVAGPVVFGQLSPSQDLDDLQIVANGDGSVTVSGIWETSDPASTSLADFTGALNATAIGADAPLYFNLHTTEFANGEIRGQLVAISGEGNDVIVGGGDADLLPGIGGNDDIAGLAGDDTIDGGTGNDTVEGGAGADSMTGGDGFDLLSYRASTTAIVVDLAMGTGTGGDAAGDNFTGFERVDGGQGDDLLIGDGEANVLWGGLFGNDTLSGGAGNDTLDGGDALSDADFVDAVDYSATTGGVLVDLAVGGAFGAEIGSDTLVRIEDIIGGAGNDTLTGDGGTNFLVGGAGNDTMDGGAGFDAADYSATTMGVSIHLRGGVASGAESGVDTLIGIEDALGGSGEDAIVGSADGNFLVGGAGDDTISGQEGDDTLQGGAGNDIVDGGAGGDQIEGLAGADTLYGSVGSDTLLGGDGDDYTDGGESNDTIDGGTGVDTLHGGAGDDSVAGGDGDDFVFGSDGNDSLDGGNGQDIVGGGAGMDTMSGGMDLDFDRIVSGADGMEDVFVMNAPGAQAAGIYDQFEGFESAVDVIDLRTTGAATMSDLGFSDYAGVGVKIIAPDGSTALLLGQQQADLMADWFLFA